MSRPCVKIRYFSRRSARQARRSLYHGHMQAYFCTACHAWHLGHLPLIVLRGYKSKAEVYA